LFNFDTGEKNNVINSASEAASILEIKEIVQAILKTLMLGRP
jgi:hypothetical protein